MNRVSGKRRHVLVGPEGVSPQTGLVAFSGVSPNGSGVSLSIHRWRFGSKLWIDIGNAPMGVPSGEWWCGSLRFVLLLRPNQHAAGHFENQVGSKEGFGWIEGAREVGVVDGLILILL